MASVNSFNPIDGIYSPQRTDLAFRDNACSDNLQGAHGWTRGNSKVKLATPDSCSFSSRCSVRLIHEIVSKFDKAKVQLVREIGFDGMLHLPLIKQINLRFSAWLMCRVDVLTQTLIISEGVRIPFVKDDVARVFGIPSSGRGICSLTPTSTIEGDSYCSSMQPINTKQLRSIKAAQAIVDRSHDGLMSPREQDEFKAAFVILVLSNLLAPSAKHDSVCDDFFPAIQQPSQIRSFDWADYVLRRLLDAINKLKTDMANHVKVPYLHGCFLFLQVLLLDSIDLGVLSMPHSSFPRIRSFTPDRLRSMIASVISFSLTGAEIVEYSRLKLRSPSAACYHWASPHDDKGVNNGGDMLALWEAVRRRTRILKVPDEAAGPLFVATADFQRQTGPIPVTEFLNHLSVLLHIMEPYVNGFSYQSSINANAPLTDLCATGDRNCCSGEQCCFHFSSTCTKRNYSMMNLDAGETSYNSDVNCLIHHGIKSLHSRGLYAHEVDIRAINAMARFYLTLRPVKATRCVDLNNSIKAGDVRSTPSLIQRRCNHFKPPLSPWDLGGMVIVDQVFCSSVRSKLCLVEDIDEPWIVHFCPKYIELLTSSVKAQFTGKSELEMEMVDAVLRRFKQIDDGLYIHEGSMRWRHFVESDFMVSLLAGWFDISHPVIRSHFCGRHISYDVTSCQMFFFPVILQRRWVCFTRRIHDNTIIVYDPCKAVNADHIAGTPYEVVADMLKSAMNLVASSLFETWNYDWSNAAIEFFTPNVIPVQMPNRSGLLCMYFCCCFDGHRLRPQFETGLLLDWSAAQLLSEVSLISPNFGKVPHVFR